MRPADEKRTSLTWWFGVAIVAAETIGHVALERSPDKWLLGLAIVFVFGLPGGLALLRLLLALVESIGQAAGSIDQQPRPEDKPGGDDDDA